MNHQPIWNFRPPALQSGKYNDLFQRYLDDCDRAQRNSDANLRQTSSRSTKPMIIPCKEAYPHPQVGRVNLRTSQWNIHALSASWLKGDKSYDLKYHGKEVGRILMDTDSDIIILNEYCVQRGYDQYLHSQKLRSILEKHGYAIYKASCSYPTAIASRIPVQEWGEFALDSKRSTVFIKAVVSDPMGSRVVTVFGTHLEDFEADNGSQRLGEAVELLRCINEVQANNTISSSQNDKGEESILIVGDLNQQREKDYNEDEWTTICASKEMRNSPIDDGVSALLESSNFQCNFDCFSLQSESKVPKCNWLVQDPPPATHWTSTIVDYTYFKGSIDLKGIYIHPSKLSDHRLVVCDWVVN